MQKIVLPALDDLLTVADIPDYPYSKGWENAKADPVLVLHTSGSTGQDNFLLSHHLLGH